MKLGDLEDDDKQILELLTKGKSIKQIHHEIMRDRDPPLSPSSVKFMMSRLYKKLGVPNSNAAVAWYVEQKIEARIAALNQPN